jgi:Lrp/AsnC family leucine-responsive transcriptional regulator
MHIVPLNLTDIDVSIIKELLKNGRKLFREISCSTGISTPTVKARFDRLVNIGFIKSISPIFDFNKIDLNIVKSRNEKSIKRALNSIDHNTYNKLIKKTLKLN